MAHNDGPTFVGNKVSAPATPPPKTAESHVFDASPSTEAAVPDASQIQLGEVINVIPPAMPAHLLAFPGLCENLLPDWETLGPDAFATRQDWASRGLQLQGQPLKDIRVIDILGDGTRVDRGDAAFEQVHTLLQTPLPDGSGVCRVIIGVPELGKVDRGFAMQAANLAGEKVVGSPPDGVFEKSHFRSRVCPSFDLARLRDLWTLEEVVWKPLLLPIPSMRAAENQLSAKQQPYERCLRMSDRDVFYFHLTWAVVQTIPLQGGKFLFLCTLPSRTLPNDSIFRSAPNLAVLKEMTKEGPSLNKEQIFDVLSRDQQRSARERFETLLLSEKSATKLANADSGKLCRLLLLDIFRAVSDTLTALTMDIRTTMGALDLPLLSDAEITLNELQNGRMAADRLLNIIDVPRHGAAHLLDFIALEGADTHDSNNDNNPVTNCKQKRWLEHVAFALRADLDHVRVEMKSFQEFWAERLTAQSEYIKNIESKNITRLTQIAAIFLPLSFGADLLGMQFRLGELGFILYDYLGLVVCCGLVLFMWYKVIPWYRVCVRFLWPRRPKQRKSVTTFIRGSLKATWLAVFVLLWLIVAASLLVGMIWDIPYSLVVLKWGCTAWVIFLSLYLTVTVLYSWVFSEVFAVLGVKLLG